MTTGCEDPLEPGCREVLRELQAFLDAECGPSVEEIIATHLGRCHPCLRRAEFERELRRLVAARCRDAAPPALRDRVLGIFRNGGMP